jgi:hypothetical protein
MCRWKANETPAQGKTTTNKIDQLELVHSDLLGPVTPESHDKKKYILTFIDDFTHFTVAYPISSKTEIPRFFRKYEAMATGSFQPKNITLQV